MTWSEKLRDPRWQKLRLEVMQRDDWKCVICDDRRNHLNVHHIVYTRHNPNPWGYNPATLQTLCKTCHEERQELIDNVANAMKLALKNVPTNRVRKMAAKLYNEAMAEL